MSVYHLSSVLNVIFFRIIRALTLEGLCISESCSEIKIKLNFYFHAFKAFIKPFEAQQRSVKIKI